MNLSPATEFGPDKRKPVIRIRPTYRDTEFGKAFGVLIKDLRILARSIFVIDQNGIIKDIQLVKELTTEPDYDQTLNAVKNL